MSADAALCATLSRIQQLEAALRTTHHALTTLHGLTASDGLTAYSDALSDGCDPAGAWDSYRAETWTIDERKALAEIDAALGLSAGGAR